MDPWAKAAERPEVIARHAAGDVLDGATLDARVADLARASPSPRAVFGRDRRLYITEETPWFLGVVFAGMFALGLLVAVSQARDAGRASGGRVAASVLFFCVSAAALAWLVVAVGSRRVLEVDGDDLVVRRGVYSRERVVRIPCEDVTEVCLRDRGGRREVVVMGPRHREWACVYTEGWLDPAALGAWVARVTALCTARAA